MRARKQKCGPCPASDLRHPNKNEMENEKRGHSQCQPHAVTRVCRSLHYLCYAYTRHAPWPPPTDPQGALAVRSNPNTCRSPLLSSCRARARGASLMHMAAHQLLSTGPNFQMIHPMLGDALFGYATPTTASIAKARCLRLATRSQLKRHTRT